jgi:hypothetical protein
MLYSVELWQNLQALTSSRSAYVHLGDWVLWAIECSTDPRLKPARTLLQRLRQRNLYQAVHVPMHVPDEIRTEEQARVGF